MASNANTLLTIVLFLQNYEYYKKKNSITFVNMLQSNPGVKSSM